ncbi:hypothetical protein A3J43_01775 [Candidatus Uhrbacteria bacterium RIFCSPHIGHO2_12_FULL_54_23]|uniref:FMN-binding domain-containing protein n=1 Tax=Candidatus Uhrbacteria bacterium RIFCSPHIGHO2_12_FULL_54_23 TaxID=1802397 RepID=A0A1F7UIS2_9BACT|nr:MAG: hypothetical protein A3J43_01775 [Candidatus Uhrbacteria bacterium RIFCSPHIGHO2_12_FULL_54_23]
MDQPASNATPANVPEPKRGFVGTLIALVALAAVGIGTAFFSKKPQQNAQPQSAGSEMPGGVDTQPAPLAPESAMPVPPATSSETAAPEMIVSDDTGAPTASSYKDGAYAAMGNYVSPGGPEQVGVTLTLENDVIIDTQFEIKAERPTSVQKQTIFSENYKPFVVGKNIDEVHLTKVSSSSLTPKGFMDALEKIKKEAKPS